MTSLNQELPPEKKYHTYEQAVQNPASDIEFITTEYKKFFQKSPFSLREDFCGTGLMANLWAQESKKHTSYGVDIDPGPMSYGREFHTSKLPQGQQKRIHYIQSDVLKKQKFTTDIICAFNFSYFTFKTRKLLKKYFKRAYQGLNKKGAFFLDLFGGTESYEPSEEETDHGDFSYFWDCDKFNPITNECQYHIHFKFPKNPRKYEKVFSYDWRLWSLAEITEVLEEAGFDEVKTYWEEDGDDEEGSGIFYESKDEENCQSWVTYIAAIKK